MVQIVLYQPDIPQNLGAFIRLTVCFATKLHIIMPCGFPLNDKKLKRVAMDYDYSSIIKKHNDWHQFQSFSEQSDARLVLLTTKAVCSYTTFQFQKNDYLILGRESAGVPEAVAVACPYKVRIPMQENARSLNVAIAGSIVLSEALRQIGAFDARIIEEC